MVWHYIRGLIMLDLIKPVEESLKTNLLTADYDLATITSEDGTVVDNKTTHM